MAHPMVGGQAVLEGVMMRGVSTWAVAVAPARRRDRRRVAPVVAWAARPDRCSCAARSLRGVVALAQSLQIGFKALEASANAQPKPEEEEITKGAWAGTVVVALLLRRRPVLRRPGRAHEPHQGPARLLVLFWLVEGLLRTAIFLGYLIRAVAPEATCAASSSTTAPSTR